MGKQWGGGMQIMKTELKDVRGENSATRHTIQMPIEKSPLSKSIRVKERLSCGEGNK